MTTTPESARSDADGKRATEAARDAPRPAGRE